jgi:hypothetical protein
MWQHKGGHHTVLSPWVSIPLVFCNLIIKLNIPCCFPFNINLFIHQLHNLCFVNGDGKLLHRFACHYDDVKFCSLPIDLFIMHIIVNNQVHKKWKPKKDRKQSAKDVKSCHKIMKIWQNACYKQSHHKHIMHILHNLTNALLPQGRI